MRDYKRDQEYYFLKVVESFLNTWYRWGGDDPSGIDCSGLVVEALKACGKISEREDYTADGLWHKYHGAYEVPDAQRGALVFWFDNKGRATHVAVCVSPFFCITANGGGKHVKTHEDAMKYNAFVKIRRLPIVARNQDSYISGNESD